MEKKFVVYKSSAGSGKTFTLVKEYLKICLSSSNPMKFREILAITFTNKAAAEMKTRIASTLQELISKDPEGHPMGEILLKETQIEKNQFIKRANSILKSILHNYADFSVSTIDQFTYRLIRTFARELHIPVNFEVEMDADNLLKKVIAMLIDKVGHDKNLSELLIKYTQSRVEEEKYYQIENEIKSFANKLMGEVGVVHLSKLKMLDIGYFIKLNEIYSDQNKAYKEKLSQLANDALQLIDQNGIEHSAFKRSSIPNWLTKIKEGDVNYFERIEKCLDCCVNNDLYPQKASRENQISIDSIAEDLASYFKEMQELFEKENALFFTRLAALKNLYPLALLNEIEKLLDEIKKEESIIHISDFNKSIFSVVDQEPIPFIYERIGEKYSHFMLDEFQDTSVLQYQNLLPLLENSLAEEKFNMLVGDGKQAIYRWRGGEVEQFSEMPEYIHPTLSSNNLYLERQQAVSNHFNEKNLSSNYRSTETVVQFNNGFFSRLKNGLPTRIKKIYDKNSQEVKSIGKAGYVSVDFVQNEDYKEVTVEKVFSTIEECKKDGFSYKDIAVLCRSNKNASLIADFLVQSGIKIISSESLLLSKSQDVQFLISCLRHVFNKEDAVAKSFMVEYICGKNNLDLHSNYSSCIGNSTNFKQFIQKYSNGFSLDGPSHLSLYELCESLLRSFGLHHTYDVYIQTFLEQVHQFHLSKNSGLSSFLDWWNEKCEKLYIDAPENMDAVQIMTIHKSKGLEFPVVIYPFADRDLSRNPNDVWVEVNNRIDPSPDSMIIASNTKNSIYQDEVDVEQEKILMDEINTNYVAFTRAVDRLYVYSKQLPKTGRENLTSTAKIIHNGLIGMEEYQEDSGVFMMGEKLPPPKAEASHEEVADLPEFISNDWKEKLSISMEAPAEWGSDKMLGALKYGNLMHKLLSGIKSVDDVGKVVADFSSKGLLSKDESGDIENELNTIINHDQIARFFNKNAKVKIEEDIITPEGTTYRPDRVIIHSDRVEVVDFKSGAKENTHIEQIQNYSRLVEEIEEKDTKAFLIYLNNREVLEV